MDRNNIPVWEQYTLSVQDAAMYFNIGEDKLRKIINEDKSAGFILWNGSRPKIKRKRFEEYIDRASMI